MIINIILEYYIMWEKTMPFLPPMTGHGLFVPHIKMVMTGGWFMKLYPHDSIQKNGVITVVTNQSVLVRL